MAFALVSLLRTVGTCADTVLRPTVFVAIAVSQSLLAVGGVIVGTRNGEQSRGLKKLLDVELEASVLQALDGASEPLKQALGADIDMWGKGRTR